MELSENIEKQLEEIEILKSIYPNPREFSIEDDDAIYEANEFLCDKDVNKILKRRIGYIIKCEANCDVDEASSSSLVFKNDKNNNDVLSKIPVEIVCRLPHDYPLSSKPEIFVRCSRDNLNLSKSFSENLAKHVHEIHNSECSVLPIIDWIKDNLFKYLSEDKNLNHSHSGKRSVKPIESFNRAWIYFHHMYNDKLQLVLKWGKEFDVTGFVFPGKPGIMCIEGDEVYVQAYLTRVKQLQWQKVQIKEIETFKVNNIKELNELRKFTTFEQKNFTNESTQTHDLGLFFNFLKEKSLSKVFSLFFGVDGKTSINNNNKSE